MLWYLISEMDWSSSSLCPVSGICVKSPLPLRHHGREFLPRDPLGVCSVMTLQHAHSACRMCAVTYTLFITVIYHVNTKKNSGVLVGKKIEKYWPLKTLQVHLIDTNIHILCYRRLHSLSLSPFLSHNWLWIMLHRKKFSLSTPSIQFLNQYHYTSIQAIKLIF